MLSDALTRQSKLCAARRFERVGHAQARVFERVLHVFGASVYGLWAVLPLSRLQRVGCRRAPLSNLSIQEDDFGHPETESPHLVQPVEAHLSLFIRSSLARRPRRKRVDDVHLVFINTYTWSTGQTFVVCEMKKKQSTVASS